jgi:hypothetical protein
MRGSSTADESSLFSSSYSVLFEDDHEDDDENFQRDFMAIGDNGIRLMILDPGHFHAALVQKKMNPSIARQVHVYAPEGAELQDYLSRIQGFNCREQDPTQWESIVHATPDY